MKMIVTGVHPDPHKCRDRIWEMEQTKKLRLGTVLECECGVRWRLQRKLGWRWWRLFSWTLSYNNLSLYWVQI